MARAAGTATARAKTIEKNVNGSRVAGWNAIRFVTNDQVEADFEKFILESH